MTVKELLGILDSIPYEILTYDNSDYEFVEKTNYKPARIEIHFKRDNKLYCYLVVVSDNTIYEGYAAFCDFDFDKVKKSISYKNCVQAMHNTKTYLEILGFKPLLYLVDIMSVANE